MADDMTLDEFFADLPKPRKRTRPAAWASPEGDCAYFYLSEEPCYRVRVDDLLTVYRSHRTRRILGGQVKGLARLPGHEALKVGLRDRGEVEMVCILLVTYKRAAKREATGEIERTRVYGEAIQEFAGRRIPFNDLVGAPRG